MASQLILVSIFLFFHSALAQSQTCGNNQEWRYGYKPEPSCNNLFPSDTSIAEGCYCIENYVRDANNECIYFYECPEFKVETTTTATTCPAGESFRTELYPEPTCDILYPEPQGIKEGCYCDNFGVRNPLGTCISVYDCPQYITTTTTTAASPVCPVGESFGLGVYPEPSCDNFFPENTFVKEGCFCASNFVRDSTGKCVDYKTCPQPITTTVSTPVCPAGEIYATELYPEPTCDNFFPDNVDYKVGCYCPDYFVRDSTGKCIEYTSCPQYITTTVATPVCPAGETYGTGLYPEPSCDNFFPENVLVKDGCYCPADFVRDSTGKCISYLECPQPVTTVVTTPASIACPAGEELRVDLYPEPSCNMLFPEYGNLKESCFCLNDNVRNAAGQCISIDQCPQFTTPATSSLTPVPTPAPIPAPTSAPNPVIEDEYAPRSFLPTFKCVPGTTFKVDCNTCTCNSDGSDASCTLMACAPEVIEAPSQICPENEVWTNGLFPEPTCNNFYPENVYVKEGCFCKENFIRNDAGKCINITDCEIFSTVKPSEIPDITIYEFTCIPGETFKVDCNLCTCAEDGKSTICTTFNCGPPDNSAKILCPEGEIYGKGMFPEATCENFFPEYSEVKEGCFCAPGSVRNSAGKCVSIYDCSPSEQSSTTTTPAPANEFVCCPGTANYTRCSVCICNEDGKSETCYEIPCAPPRDDNP